MVNSIPKYISNYRGERFTVTIITYSTKIEEETKDRMTALIEQSGMTAKDFMSRLVTTYEMTQARDSVKEIDNLRHHLTRVEEIYVSIFKAGQDRATADAASIAEAMEEARNAKAAAHTAQEEAKRIVEETQRQAQETVTDVNSRMEASGAELEELRLALQKANEDREQALKLAALSEKVATDAQAEVMDLRGAADELAACKKDFDRVLKDNSDMQHEIENLRAEIKKALHECDEQSKQHTEDIEKLKTTAAAELNQQLKLAAERAETEKRNAVLGEREKSLNRTGELQDSVSSLRESMANLREEKAALEVQLAKDSQKPKSPRNKITSQTPKADD